MVGVVRDPLGHGLGPGRIGPVLAVKGDQLVLGGGGRGGAAMIGHDRFQFRDTLRGRSPPAAQLDPARQKRQPNRVRLVRVQHAKSLQHFPRSRDRLALAEVHVGLHQHDPGALGAGDRLLGQQPVTFSGGRLEEPLAG